MGEWFGDLRAAELARVEAEVGRGVPWKHIQRRVPREARLGAPTVDAMAVVAAARAERRQRQVLTEIGLQRRGNPPLDLVAQEFLPSARIQVANEQDSWIDQELDRRLGRGDGERKRLAQSPQTQQREALAWEYAKEQARGELMVSAAQDATRSELDTMADAMESSLPPTERRASANGNVRVLDEQGQRLPVEAFFDETGTSPFAAEEWAALPTRPVV